MLTLALTLTLTLTLALTLALTLVLTLTLTLTRASVSRGAPPSGSNAQAAPRPRGLSPGQVSNEPDHGGYEP